MRIALVTRGDLYPTHHGAAVKIVRTAEYLSMLGDDVFIVTDNPDFYLGYTKGQVREIPYGPRFRAAEEWPGVHRATALAERLCLRVGYPSEELFLYRPQFDPAWWARVLYVGRKERVDLFQAEFPGYAFACAAAARALGVRSALVQHNVEWDRLVDVAGLGERPIRRIRALELAAIAAVDEVIAVSEDDRQRMVQAGAKADKITVIPHGVDTLSYRERRSEAVRYGLSLDPDAPVIFFHGTLHYWPNTRAVAWLAEEILPRLMPRHPRLRALVVGMNPPTYYAHPAMLFTGPVDDLPRHIAAADVCVCPVQSGGGTRMKLLEYFAAGKATVSTTKGAEGIRYEAGRDIAIADDADAFADAIDALLRDPEARRRMGEQARAFAAWYDWTAIAQRTLELYSGQGRGGDYNREIATATRPIAALPRPLPPVNPIEAHLPQRVPSKPLTLLLLVNRGCNLRCVFCDLWDRPENMPYERVVALLDEAQAIGTKTLVLTGGEPFMHPRLFDIVRAARERGMGVNITTNGTLVEKRWEELREAGVDSLSVSVDGLAPTHDALRGQPGCHSRTMKALTRLRQEGGVGVSLYFVVTRKNVHELPEVYELSRQIGAGFDFWPVNDAKDLYLIEEEDKARYREAVAYVAAREPAVAARRHFYEEGLAYHDGLSGPVRCLGLVDQYGVTYEGDLLPCCVWGGEDLKVGNVFETPLRELWSSEPVQRYRQRLWGEGCTAGCFNHSLYELTRSTGESFRVS